MKIRIDIADNFIDVWNEESEEWDRYIKIEKKSIVEEEKKIPEKICTNRIINTKDILEFEMIQNKINAEYTYAINEIIDYLKSKGE